MSNAIAAGIAYVANGRVLLVMRAAESDNGETWALPGGKVEPGETFEQAAVRESFEEIGFGPITPLQFLNDDGHFVTFRSDCDEFFTPILNYEHTMYQWADPVDPPQPLHPGLAKILTMIGGGVQSKRTKDLNGWYEIKDNPISKVGVFPYLGSSIPGAPDPNAVYNVYRPEEELSDPDAIRSFQLLPFVNDHPANLLGSEAYDLPTVDGKPADGVIGEQVYYKDGYLYANLKLFTDRIAQAIEAGKREVSAGYRCIYEKASGVFNGQAYDYVQRKIRGNHVALVNEGRSGPEVAVLDHFTFSFDSKELVKMADENKNGAAATDDESGKKAMTVEEITAVLADVVPQIAKLNEAMAAIAKPTEPAAPAATDEEEPAGEPAAMDKLEQRVKALEAENAELRAAQGKGLDTKQVFRAAAERDALYRQVSPVIGAFDHAEMTTEDIAKYAVGKLGLENVPAGSEVVAVKSYLSAKPAAKASAFDSKTTGGEPSAIRQHVGATA